ncbi:sn-1-specific diacylglycerol lipase ABHD11 isoform X2 [Prorops nasuta]
MHWADQAGKEPIIIMHGLFGSKNNWNSLAKAIQQKTDRKVITIDARNHGDSPHSSEHTYQHMALDIVQLVLDLNFKKTILVGHSMGGSTMMYVALNFPDMVKKLIVVDMSPVRASPNLHEMSKIFGAMRSVTINGIVPLSKARKVADEQLSATIQPLALRQFLITNIVEEGPGQYKWRINIPALEKSFSTQIAVFPNVGEKKYLGPTLFIGGSKSDFIRTTDHEAIKNLFPSAQFTYIQDAHHWVHADKPAEFLDTLINFTNKRNLLTHIEKK